MSNTFDGKTLGDVIREARVKKGKLRQMAPDLGVTPSYLSDIENDRRVPAENVLKVFAEKLDLEFDDLMAIAGRLGDEATRYIQRNPAAASLIRRISERKLGPEELQKLRQEAEKLGDEEESKE